MSPRVDVLGGGALVVIAIASLVETTELELGSLRSFGPGMLPTILAVLLLVCGAALLAMGLLQRRPETERFQAAWRGPVLIGVAILVFALTLAGMDEPWLVVPQFGLAIVGPVTLVLAGYASEEADMRDLAAVGFGLTAACLALFNDALGMDIPVVPGLVETWMIDTLGTDTTLRLIYGALLAVTAILGVTRRRPAP